jgi:hypothetical protein
MFHTCIADLVVILLLLLWSDPILLLWWFRIDDLHLILVKGVKVLLFGGHHDRDFVLVVGFHDTEIFADFIGSLGSP